MNKSCTFLGLLMLLSACNNHDIPRSTVMITNLAGNSGGSGSIIETNDSSSFVLTNAHVCGVAANGGLVHTADGAAYAVLSYRLSAAHDLCIIKVAADLGSSTADIGHVRPELFEESTVAGHPRLYPTIITKGHFTGKTIIQVFVGLKPCTDEQLKDPEKAMFCALVGGIPTIKNYEAVLVSSLIQPGSSGSAVYGKDGRLKAVIFAGDGNIGFGFAVPLEYVRNFIDNEYAEARDIFPQTSSVIEFAQNSKSKKSLRSRIEEYCSQAKTDVQKSICDEYKGMTFFE